MELLTPSLLRWPHKEGNNDSATLGPLVAFHHRYRRFCLFSTGTVGDPRALHPNHEAWLKRIAEKIEAIKPGMTRWDLLKVLRAKGPSRRRFVLGGRPQELPESRETFVSRDCPALRIDVEFEPAPVDQPATAYQDVIVKVSKPYLQFAEANQSVSNPDKSDYRTCGKWRIGTCPVSAFTRT